MIPIVGNSISLLTLTQTQVKYMKFSLGLLYPRNEAKNK